MIWILIFIAVTPLWTCQCSSEASPSPTHQEAASIKVDTIGDYTIQNEQVEIDGNKNHRITISQNGQVLFSDTSPNIAWFPQKLEDTLSLGGGHPVPLDLAGDKSFQYIILTTHSGGAHCCVEYHVFKLSENFEHELIKCHGNGGIHFESVLGGPYIGKTTDEVLLYYKSFCYANSVRPDIILTFQEGHFVLDKQAMKRTISEATYQATLSNILKLVDTKIAKGEGKELDYTLLQWVVDLIYSGNARFAWQAFESIRQKYPLFLSGNVEERKVTDWDKEKQDIIAEIKKSPYYSGILNINDGKLD